MIIIYISTIITTDQNNQPIVDILFFILLSTII